MSGARTHHWLSKAAIVAAFLIATTTPFIGTLAGVDGGDAAGENRQLAVFARFDGTWASAKGYPRAFSDWFGDHFAFRKDMVRWFGESRYDWLHVSPSSQVTLGKDGFAFYADDFSLDDYAHERPLSEDELANWRAAVVRLRDWLTRQNIAYVFTIAPDKYLLYPEAFPDTVERVNPASRADQVYNALSDTRVVADVRPALEHQKLQERLYYLTDTHWNARGAFTAYRTIAQAANAQQPAVPPPLSRAEFAEVPRHVEGGDLAGMMGLKHVIGEDDVALVPRTPRRARVIEPPGWDPTRPADTVITEIAGSTLPRAVIFRDSFGSALIPFLSEHFSRAVYVWQNDVDANLIKREHPDVVIEEIVSRHLYTFVPSPELVP